MSTIRFFVLLLILLSSYQHVYAQSTKGKVTNKQHEPVSFATVVLQSLPDSAIVKTEMTDTSGNYTITLAGNFPLLLTVASAGYNNRSEILIDNSATVNFTLENAVNTLNNVTVTSQKKLVERKIDRTIFNVESSVSSIGSDAFDVLKKAPGVRVSQGNISIAGKSTVSVMLNDRLLQLSGDELESFLRSIPSGSISSIEVITTPPAKYDAQGNAGIIKIITKKSMKNGFNGNITASYAQRISGSENIEGAFNWRQGKLNIFGNGNSTWFTFTSPQNTTTYYTDQRQEQHLDQVNKPWFYRTDLGADYNISANSVIGITYTNGNLNKDLDQYYTTNVFNALQNRLDSMMNTNAHTKEYGHRDVFGLNYEWKIDTTGKKLNIDAEYFNRKGNTYRVADINNFFTDGSPTGFKDKNATYGYNNVLMKDAKLDLTLPTKLATFELGGKVSFIQNSSANIFSNYDGNIYVLDTSRTDHFTYTENTEALYISAQKSRDKWEMKAGLRAEYTQTKAVSIASSQANVNDYLKLFPTVYIQYKPCEDNIFSINYSRRIDRPEFWIMNPFRTYFTATSYEQGNPFLQPAFSNNLEFNYTFKSDYTLTLSTQQVQHQFVRLAVTDSSQNYFYYTQANAGTSRNYGATFSANIHPTHWWEGSVQAYGYYNLFSSNYYGQSVSYSLFAFSADMNNSFILNHSKTLIAEFGANFTSLQQVDFEQQAAEGFVFGGLKALLFKKQLILALSTEDPFRTQVDKVHNLYNGTTEINYLDNRVVQFALTWKFGNRTIKEKRERETNEDAKRIN